MRSTHVLLSVILLVALVFVPAASRAAPAKPIDTLPSHCPTRPGEICLHGRVVFQHNSQSAPGIYSITVRNCRTGQVTSLYTRGGIFLLAVKPGKQCLSVRGPNTLWSTQCVVSRPKSKNTVTFTLRVGDVDLNGTINAADLALIRQDLGKCPPMLAVIPPRYAATDLDRDGCITQADLLICRSNQGQSAAPCH